MFSAIDNVHCEQYISKNIENVKTECCHHFGQRNYSRYEKKVTVNVEFYLKYQKNKHSFIAF